MPAIIGTLNLVLLMTLTLTMGHKESKTCLVHFSHRCQLISLKQDIKTNQSRHHDTTLSVKCYWGNNIGLYLDIYKPFSLKLSMIALNSKFDESITLSWRSKISCYAFHVSSTLVCQFLSVAQFIETSTTKSVFLWYRSQRDVHIFCEWRLPEQKT